MQKPYIFSLHQFEKIDFKVLSWKILLLYACSTSLLYYTLYYIGTIAYLLRLVCKIRVLRQDLIYANYMLIKQIYGFFTK